MPFMSTMVIIKFKVVLIDIYNTLDKDKHEYVLKFKIISMQNSLKIYPFFIWNITFFYA